MRLLLLLCCGANIVCMDRDSIQSLHLDYISHRKSLIGEVVARVKLIYRDVTPDKLKDIQLLTRTLQQDEKKIKEDLEEFEKQLRSKKKEKNKASEK